MSARQNARPSHERDTFQVSQPLYVKGKTLQASGKFYKRGELFPWKELGMKPERVANMFPRLVHHKIDANAAPRADEGPKDPPTMGKPRVRAEPTAEELLTEKGTELMSVRELRIIAKHLGAPIKRTRADQLDAVDAALATQQGA